MSRLISSILFVGQGMDIKMQAIRAVIVIATVGVITQCVRVIFQTIQNQKFERSYRRTARGFPSLHAAISSSIITIIYIEQKVSLLFIAVLFFAASWRYDSLVLRKEVTRHPKCVHNTRDDLMDVFVRGKHTPIGHKIVGHTVPEILAGIIVGIVLTSTLYLA